MKPTAMAMRAVFLYPIFTSILPEGIPINRYARKFIIFPIIPKVLAPAYWFFPYCAERRSKISNEGNHREKEEHCNDSDDITVLFLLIHGLEKTYKFIN